MIVGRIDGKISEKFQTAFPKRFRDELGDILIITKGLENCLIIVSEENWKTLLEGTEGRPFTNKATRELQRFLLGNAEKVELDAKGRFIIPEYLRKHAMLKQDIIYAGLERFIEVWDKVEWEKHQKTLAENISSIAERLNEGEKSHE